MDQVYKGHCSSFSLSLLATARKIKEERETGFEPRPDRRKDLIKPQSCNYPEEMLPIENEPVRDPHDFAGKVAFVDDARNKQAEVQDPDAKFLRHLSGMKNV